MGCLMIGVAALLAFAVPASIAPASLVGAYVVIALLAAAAASYVVRAVPATPLEPRAGRTRRSRWLIRIAVAAAVYAAAVTVIHAVA